MIQANEIRVGCIFEIDGEVRKFNISDFEYSNYQIAKPIELSPDILLKCGAEKQNIGYTIDIGYFKPEFKCLYIDIQQGIMGVRYGNKDKPRHEDELIVIHNKDVHGELYLHKIQNTYYLFTGQELNIKL